jgi:hypothetical protein
MKHQGSLCFKNQISESPPLYMPWYFPEFAYFCNRNKIQKPRMTSLHNDCNNYWTTIYCSASKLPYQTCLSFSAPFLGNHSLDHQIHLKQQPSLSATSPCCLAKGFFSLLVAQCLTFFLRPTPFHQTIWHEQRESFLAQFQGFWPCQC